MSTRILLSKSSKASVNNVLTFTAVEDNSTIKLTKVGSPSAVSLLYSLNGSSWTNYTIDDIITLNNAGNYVSFKGTTTIFSKGNSSYYKFAMSGKIAATGNTNSLINYSDLTDYCYKHMFQDCTSLTTAPQLPAFTLATQCYQQMFSNCTNLITAPQLPATNLANQCYYDMFASCTSLIEAPQLPATTLATRCYYEMFYNCTSLTTAPQLPASTLATQCYYRMFQNCTSLTEVSILSATTLATYCYSQMFSGCTSLTKAPQLPATTLAPRCYASMFYNCTSLTTAPELPAITLKNYCYMSMFQNCSSLSSINVNFTDWNTSNNSTTNWLSNVASLGIFTCPTALGTNSTITRGSSYCLTNWTVINK